MKHIQFILSLISLSIINTNAFAHGNVDISNGSQIDVYVANEKHHGHSSSDSEKAYGIEAVWMHDTGFFIYAEAETGAHDFYQFGGGKYVNAADNIGLFAYGAYAQGGYNDSNELRARLGIDYQATHELGFHGRVGYDYGNSKTSSVHEHEHSFHSQSIESARSNLGRIDMGFSYELGQVAEFSYNYVMQRQFVSELVEDNDTNLHYEARLTYTATTLKPYVEYRQTNKAFDQHHFEESTVQFGISFNY
ncbi:hypothetical protein GT360_16130 [Vibrio astriarenae]|uniref:Porin n=1 Tax=Vibrio astriarenae TaxID=1481923 RepID=A0A7Z2YFE0_9VIBR|nr:hypothetical protein [Vibrio astriarenae]QIA65089.1 hypothetical protein GT360_16130 [Vibrio astriarenae]